MLGFLRSLPKKHSEPATLPSLVVGGRVVPIELNRNAQSRRLTLRADAIRGCLRVTLPSRTRLSEAAKLIDAHGDWIATQVARWPVAMPFVPGALIPFMGGQLRLAWDPGRSRGLVRIEDKLVVGGDPATLPGRVTRWLRAQALAELTPATRDLAARVERPLTAVRIGDPAARWGSCGSSGRIAYSWRLILAPPGVCHSVVAHEVAHLVHPNHGRDFWKLAAELNGGDPAPERAWLRANGAGLHWVGRAA